MNFTDEQKEAARRMQREYEGRIEMIWDDMSFELGMKLKLTDEQIAELLNRTA